VRGGFTTRVKARFSFHITKRVLIVLEGIDRRENHFRDVGVV
jgi:hypothetical protein